MKTEILNNPRAKFLRRHARILAVWRRTKSANTAERCRILLAVMGREYREGYGVAYKAEVST